jgi:hypothetical protein
VSVRWSTKKWVARAASALYTSSQQDTANEVALLRAIVESNAASTQDQVDACARRDAVRELGCELRSLANEVHELRNGELGTQYTTLSTRGLVDIAQSSRFNSQMAASYAARVCSVCWRVA